MKESFLGVIAQHHDIVLAYLFGSQVQGNVGALSDTDIALLLDRTDETGRVRHSVGSVIASEVPHGLVDVVCLNAAPIELAYAVIATGELIYQRDDYARVEYEAKIMSLYCDYLPVLRAQRDDLLRGGGHETRVQRYREALRRTERTLGAAGGAEG
jgi:predicted nucleotidyltransferase